MSRSSYDLTDKVVLITGGNGGIGAAAGAELLRRGARLVVADLDPLTPERSAALGPERSRAALPTSGIDHRSTRSSPGPSSASAVSTS
ncbi:hypothetical protein [Nocardioides sp. B-3]|uniref:hypothetical protein n=1 Tax=Nocardioides sp. B-3 TaxID=2895565 RepID=UPI0021535776|nr:hypothetical protein [Nocardioides sp. B-3]UUZ58231.1 hypothetical protein LP418_18530 [Nocardioides sp. B-3]